MGRRDQQCDTTPEWLSGCPITEQITSDAEWLATWWPCPSSMTAPRTWRPRCVTCTMSPDRGGIPPSGTNPRTPSRPGASPGRKTRPVCGPTLREAASPPPGRGRESHALRDSELNPTSSSEAKQEFIIPSINWNWMLHNLHFTTK